MSYLANGIYRNLKEAFAQHSLSLSEGPDHLKVSDSDTLTDKTIRNIVESRGFCPILAKRTNGRPVVFTVVPYAMPIIKKEENIESYRDLVSPAIYKCFYDVLCKTYRANDELVEIGSGLTMTISEYLMRNAAPIKSVRAESYLESLIKNGKTVQLFFGVNAFDTYSEESLEKTLALIHQIQNVGDRILLIKDFNPCIDTTITRLEKENPGHYALPFFYHTKHPQKLHVILVPSHLAKKPLLEDWSDMVNSEAMMLHQGIASPMQQKLHKLQEEKKLQVIELESNYATWMKAQLEQSGYGCKAYYHNAFVEGKPPKTPTTIMQDLIYKSITDTSSVRQWSYNDPILADWLSKKGLKLPSYPGEYLSELKRNGKVILGAEIYVIEAEKK